MKPDILLVPIGDILHAVFSCITRRMLALHKRTPPLVISSRNIQKRPSIYRRRYIDSSGIEQCGHHIAQLHRMIVLHPSRHIPPCIGILHNKWDARRSFVRIRLPPVVMVAHHIAVIRCKNNQSIAICLRVVAAQLVQHAPNLVINKHDIAVISRPPPVRFRIGTVRTRRIDICNFFVELCCPVSHSGFGDIVIVDIHIPIRLGRIIRRMGTRK